MKTGIVANIIKGYESQLANAEIARDQKKINWLKDQINEGHKMIAQFGTYTDDSSTNGQK